MRNHHFTLVTRSYLPAPGTGVLWIGLVVAIEQKWLLGDLSESQSVLKR